MIEYVIHGQCKSYKDVPEGAMVERVHGREVLDYCEACGKPIFCDDDTSVSDGDGVYFHGRCAL